MLLHSYRIEPCDKTCLQAHIYFAQPEKLELAQGTEMTLKYVNDFLWKVLDHSEMQDSFSIVVACHTSTLAAASENSSSKKEVILVQPRLKLAELNSGLNDYTKFCTTLARCRELYLLSFESHSTFTQCMLTINYEKITQLWYFYKFLCSICTVLFKHLCGPLEQSFISLCVSKINHWV